MTQETDVKIGDTLTADSTWDDAIGSQLFVVLSDDGSRRIDERQTASSYKFEELTQGPRLLERSDSWLCWGAG